MVTIRGSFFISGAAIALIIIAPLVALAAWSEPSQAPTGGNVDPPINTGSQSQIKNGGLTVTGFAVFGSTALNGNTYLKTGVTGSIYRYLNFGADYDVNGNVISSTIGESGYGIRDKDGTLEFKNSGGSWDSIQKIVYNLVGSAAPVCTVRRASTSTKTSCGFSSQVSCAAGEFVMSGGMYGGANDALQTSEPVGTTDWRITGYDISSSGACSQNYIANGTVATGNPPSQGAMRGAAVAVCCHM